MVILAILSYSLTFKKCFCLRLLAFGLSLAAGPSLAAGWGARPAWRARLPFGRGRWGLRRRLPPWLGVAGGRLTIVWALVAASW